MVVVDMLWHCREHNVCMAAGGESSSRHVTVYCWGGIVVVVLAGLRWQAVVGGRESGSGCAAAFWGWGDMAGVLLCWRSRREVGGRKDQHVVGGDVWQSSGWEGA